MGQAYGFSYTYNLAGALTSETYPSGRTIQTDYDPVNRVSKVSGVLAGQTKNYASDIGYWAHGAPNYYALGIVGDRSLANGSANPGRVVDFTRTLK